MTNILQDSGFESGAFSPWWRRSSGSNVANTLPVITSNPPDVYQGTYACHMTNPLTLYPLTSIENPLPPSPRYILVRNALYQFTMHVKYNAILPGGTPRMYFEFDNYFGVQYDITPTTVGVYETKVINFYARQPANTNIKVTSEYLDSFVDSISLVQLTGMLGFPDPDFENAVSSWGFFTGTASITSDPANVYSGTKAGVVGLSSGPGNFSGAAFNTVIQNVPLTLSLWIKSDSVDEFGRSVRLRMTQTASHETTWFYRPSTLGVYENAVFTYRITSESTALSLEFFNLPISGGPAHTQVYVDLIYLQAIDSTYNPYVIPPSTAIGLMSNGGFEIGSIGDWILSATSRIAFTGIPSEAYQGNYAIQFDFSRAWSMMRSFSNLTPGSNYRLSAYIKRAPGPGISPITAVLIITNGSVSPQIITVNFVNSAIDIYEYLEQDFIAQDNFVNIAFSTGSDGSLRPTAVVDNIGFFDITVCYSGDSTVKALVAGEEKEIRVAELTEDDLVWSVRTDSYVVVRKITTSHNCRRYYRIPQDSISDGVPSEDFLITPGHEIRIDNTWIKARDCPSSIYQTWPSVRMYNILTKETETLLINGVRTKADSFEEFYARRISFPKGGSTRLITHK